MIAPVSRARPPGVTLVETTLSLGVLAVITPLLFAAMTRAGSTGSTSRTDSRSAGIIEACLEEIRLAQRGASGHLDPIPSEGALRTDPPICLSFDRTGRILGTVGEEARRQGAPPRESSVPAYFATIRGDKADSPHPSMTQVSITIEHPAVLPDRKRTKIRFYTQIP